MTARIYKPAKTAMQSGQAKTHDWVLDYEPEEPRVVESLMGWTSSGDMKSQVQLQFATKEEAKANVKNAITAAAKLLHNTPTICRKCYVHPAIVASYLNGDLIEGLQTKLDEAEEITDFSDDERAVLNFLNGQIRKKNGVALQK